MDADWPQSSWPIESVGPLSATVAHAQQQQGLYDLGDCKAVMECLAVGLMRHWPLLLCYSGLE